MTHPPSARGAWLVGLALLLAALAPRLWAPAQFITWDELTWTYRSVKFLAALRAGNPAGTYLTGHPGVVTSWAGAAGLALAPGGAPDPTWSAALPDFDENNVELVRQLAPWLPAARVPLSALSAGLVVAAWVALRRLVLRSPFPGLHGEMTGEAVALLAGLLLAFDPFLLAHSRLLHLDAAMAGLMFVSVLSLLVALMGRGGRGWLAASGALAGLAVLEKSPAVFLIPFAGLTIAWLTVSQCGLTKQAVRLAAMRGGVWGLAAVATYFAAWPALWVAPGAVLTAVWVRANQSAGEPREAVFFLGQVVRDPGGLFYLASSAFRLTPVTSLGFVLAAGYSLYRLLRRRPLAQPWPLVVLVYAVLFWVFISTGAKKYDRYILPVQPALDALAALGLAWAWAAVSRRLPGAPARPWAGVLALGLLQAAFVLPYHPYYLSCYNPVLGGGSRAAQVLPVGWGEGMEQAAAYLNARPGADRLRLATSSLGIFAPLFRGQAVKLREKDVDQADYVLVYVDDAQIGQPVAIKRFYGAVDPEYVVQIHGIAYAWIYRVARN